MTSRVEAAEILNLHFGMNAASIQELDGEHDHNFLITSDGGERILLKCHRPSTDESYLEMQDLVLCHLEAKGAASPRHRQTQIVDGRAVRLLSWVEGDVWAQATDGGSANDAQLRELGQIVASTDKALADFSHPALIRNDSWNLLQAVDLPQPTNEWSAAVLADADLLTEKLTCLPLQAIHNDANENNIVVAGNGSLTLIDYGDIVSGPRIVGLGVAVAYAMFAQPDPLRAACHVVAGYHYEEPLLPEELDLLHQVVRLRLAMSIANAEQACLTNPDNSAYLGTSQTAVLALGELLDKVEPELATASYRHACGYTPVAAQRTISSYFSSIGFRPAPLMDSDLSIAPILDWTVGSPVEAAVPVQSIALGRWREVRGVYKAPEFETPFGERRTLHMGIDVFSPAGTELSSPLDGVVIGSEIRNVPGDYGGVIVLEFCTPDGTPFWFLMGHLSHQSVNEAPIGRRVRAGEVIAVLGVREENGGWAPHVHVQLFTSLLGKPTDMDGVARASQVAVWSSISPSPAPLLAGVSYEQTTAPTTMDDATILGLRRTKLSSSLSTSYRKPIHMVRGDGSHLIDSEGKRWLDLVNNVAHVGHEHPRVVDALTNQARLLNTNTRYLHPKIVEYAGRISELFPDPLSVVLLTNSGSEALDLALRLARTATGRTGSMVMDWAYHGNLTSLIAISPYKFNRAGGAGLGPNVGVCELPDAYRGEKGSDGEAYASDVALQAQTLARTNPPAAFLHESISGCGGQIDLAPGYLAAAYRHARSAGALCIADEVQCGMGRVGDAWSAFENQDVVPDIVTLGKPIGNGHPMGAVITTPEVARAFRNGMEYFNTFAGNPVSCSVGLAVLDVIRDERLIANADLVGQHLVAGLRELSKEHNSIGDVRGRGLFLGVDLVSDRETKTPNPRLATFVVEGLLEHQILISSDGPDNNVLKIKPPMVITISEANRVLDALNDVLGSASNV